MVSSRQATVQSELNIWRDWSTIIGNVSGIRIWTNLGNTIYISIQRARLNITVGHRTMSDENWNMSDGFSQPADILTSGVFFQTECGCLEIICILYFPLFIESEKAADILFQIFRSFPSSIIYGQDQRSCWLLISCNEKDSLDYRHCKDLPSSSKILLDWRIILTPWR